MQQIKVKVNGESYQVEVPDHRTLLDFLRQDLELMGTKSGCETGDCGACTVLLNGKAVNSCLYMAVQAGGKKVLTIEGLKNENGGPHPLVQAFADEGAVQCGFCTPGMIMSAYALLLANHAPSRDEIKEALSGNICRCTGYEMIFSAVEKAAGLMNARGKK